MCDRKSQSKRVHPPTPSPEALKCHKRGIRRGGDVISALNVEERYLTLEGARRSLNEPAPEVAVPSSRGWAGEAASRDPEGPQNGGNCCLGTNGLAE